jgi:hypothetical protein
MRFISLDVSVCAFLSVLFCLCLSVRAYHSVPFFSIHDFQSVTFFSVSLPFHALTDPSFPPSPGGADEAGDEVQNAGPER